MRLGILGGSFDPIHIGHLRLAIEAKEAFALDKVVLEVAALSPFKPDSNPAPSEARLAMVEAAIESSSGLATGNVEIQRGPPSYMVDTVSHYKSESDEIWLILGADALAGFDDWKEPERLLGMCHLAVGMRPTDSATESPAGVKAEMFDIPLLEVSSTEIRAKVKAGRSINHLTPDSVVQIIASRRLYV